MRGARKVWGGVLLYLPAALLPTLLPLLPLPLTPQRARPTTPSPPALGPRHLWLGVHQHHQPHATRLPAAACSAVAAAARRPISARSFLPMVASPAPPSAICTSSSTTRCQYTRCSMPCAVAFSSAASWS